MKLTFRHKVKHGAMHLCCTAVISKSKSLGIEKRIQKSWTTPHDPNSSMYSDAEVRKLFRRNSEIWLMGQMRRMFGERAPEFLQSEIVSVVRESAQ